MRLRLLRKVVDRYVVSLTILLDVTVEADSAPMAALLANQKFENCVDGIEKEGFRTINIGFDDYPTKLSEVIE